MSFSGTATSTEGAHRARSPAHFQVGSCQALKFKPDFKVSTSGKTSRKDGASLEAKIVYPTTPLGDNQASARSRTSQSVKVDLPKQLPSRLTTLQKACTAAQFEANPAGCPAASLVGHATAITPVLPVPLNGPAYFVSHGGEAFPSLIVVLQGYGVTVDLVGYDVHQQGGDHEQHLQAGPRRPDQPVRPDAPRGPVLRARREPTSQRPLQLLRTETHDADSVHRAERRRDQPVHPDQRHRLHQGKKALTRAQKLTAALKACTEEGEGQARKVRNAGTEEVRRGEEG